MQSQMQAMRGQMDAMQEQMRTMADQMREMHGQMREMHEMHAQMEKNMRGMMSQGGAQPKPETKPDAPAGGDHAGHH